MPKEWTIDEGQLSAHKERDGGLGAELSIVCGTQAQLVFHSMLPGVRSGSGRMAHAHYTHMEQG